MQEIGRYIGDYIRAQRNNAQMSLRQLVKIVGVSNPCLSQVERGLRKPSARILQRIATGLRISVTVTFDAVRNPLFAVLGAVDAATGAELRKLAKTCGEAVQKATFSLVERGEEAAYATRSATRTAANRAASPRKPSNGAGSTTSRPCRQHRNGRLASSNSSGGRCLRILSGCCCCRWTSGSS